MNGALATQRAPATRAPDRGSVAVFALLVCLALTALLGLVAEGGAVLSAREQAMAAAEQAARTGAAQLSAATLHAGGIIDAAPACVKTAEAALAELGVRGTATAAGDEVTVTVTPFHVSTPLLALVGFTSMTVSARASAVAIGA